MSKYDLKSLLDQLDNQLEDTKELRADAKKRYEEDIETIRKYKELKERVRKYGNSME